MGRGDRQRPPANVQLAMPDLLRTQEATSPFGMVVASSQGAAWAGVEMLESGGNAIDAAVAACFAAGVTEPGSAGLGGQTLMLVWLSDGRGVAIYARSTVARPRGQERAEVLGPRA